MILRMLASSVALVMVLVPSLQARAAEPTQTQTVDLSSAAGAAWEFQPEGGAWRAIRVPSGGWRAQGYTCDAGTYRAWLTMPASIAGRQIKLAFAAVNFGAEVSAGTNESHPARRRRKLTVALPRQRAYRRSP